MPYLNEAERAAGQQLFRSIEQRDEDRALRILASGISIGLEQIGVDTSNSSTGCTSLMQAARRGFHRVILALLREGACVAAVDFNGCTALMYAALNAHPLAVYMLLHLNATDATPAMRRVEFMCTIGKMTLMPRQSTMHHASCLLMILDSVRSHAQGMWQFLPEQSQEQLRRLQALVFSVTATVQRRALSGFLRWHQVSRERQQLSDSAVTRVMGLIMAKRGAEFGIGAKKRMIMNASMLRKLLLRQAASAEIQSEMRLDITRLMCLQACGSRQRFPLPARAAARAK